MSYMWFRYQFWGQIESLTYKTCRCGIASRWIEVGQVDQIASCRCPLSRDVSLLLCPKTPQDHLKIHKTRLPWFFERPERSRKRIQILVLLLLHIYTYTMRLHICIYINIHFSLYLNVVSPGSRKWHDALIQSPKVLT